MDVNHLMISCIVIGYNIENYIKSCLTSIIEQDYDNFEVIFVNDGSTDNTYTIVKKYFNDQVKIINKENGGIISARKAGVKCAKGEYIIFVDGDDFINLDMFSSMINAINKEVNCIDILQTDQWNQDASGKCFIHKSSCDYGIYNGEEYLLNILDDRMLHFMFPKMYRREFLINAGYLEFPNITIGEDLLTNVCLAVSNPAVLYVEQTNYYYRYNEESVTRKENNEILQQAKTIELIEKFMKHKSVYEKYHEHLEYLWNLYAFRYIQLPFSTKFKKKLINTCKVHLKQYSKNSVYILYKKERSLAGRILFACYLKFPVIAVPLDKIIMHIRNRKNKRKK